MECEKYVCVWLGVGWEVLGVGVVGLRLGFTNPVETWTVGTCACVWVAVACEVLKGVDYFRKTSYGLWFDVLKELKTIFKYT